MNMKKFSLISIILLLFAFLGYTAFQDKSYTVFKVIEANHIIVDFNKNGSVDIDEDVILPDFQTFSLTSSDEQRAIAKQLNISEEDSLALGYYSQKYAQNLLEDKLIKIKKNKDGFYQISQEGKDYIKLIINSPFALKDNKPLNPDSFKKQIDLLKKAELRIYNNKSNKFHYLTCKYGQIAHDSVILPKNQLPKDASPCKFCQIKEKIPQKIKKSVHKYVYNKNSIELFLSDLTTVYKPDNNCSTDYCKLIVNQINSSNKSIDIALYGYTDIPAITEAIKKAMNRGVYIRFVYDIDTKDSNLYPETFRLANLIKNSNTDIGNKNYQGALMHNKFFIFDDENLITGSANLSNTDMSGFNSNAIIFIKSKEIANIYKEEFEQMYSAKFHNSKSKIENKENIPVGNSIISVYFSPTDSTINEMIIPMIDNAKHYVYMPIFIITHEKLVQALIAAKKRGVDVRLIIDATNTSRKDSLHNIMRKNKILVKSENYAGKLHSKSIIIDDKYVILGSMNFSKSGENKNDENVLLIENEEIAKYYKDFFLYLWQRIPNKWLFQNARAESHDSIGSCNDGIDNDFDGKIDSLDEGCR